MDKVFRIKKIRDAPSRTKTQDIVSGTLDSLHTTIVNDIHEKQTSLGDMRTTIDENLIKIEELDKKTDLESILSASKLRNENKRLQQFIDQQDPLKDYYLKNADIMLQYYGNEVKSGMQLSSNDQNTFMRFLQPKVENGISKKQLFEEYASRMKLNTGTETEQHILEHCERCNVSREEISEEGILVCPMCGSEEYMLVVSDFPSFRDPPKERNNYAYKKINHLNEILNQFQAKESTIVSDEIMNEVICEIKKQRIENIAELTDNDMRTILKKLNRSKSYEHTTHILSRLNGNLPPTITPEIEEKIRTLFQEIQAPFLLHCPDDRVNFLSYSYILYKLFELLDLDEYKVYFPLLKSRDRLIQHDQTWKKICEYCRWEYSPSV